MLFLLYVTVGAPAVGHELDFGSSPLAAERLVDLATTHLSPITIDLHIVILLPSSFTAAPSQQRLLQHLRLSCRVLLLIQSSRAP